MRPVWHPLVVILAAIGAVTVLVAVVGQNWAPLQGTFQAFGMRRILLAVMLIVIMALRPEGIMGRAEFSWAWLLRERKDQPSDDERAQDAWLSNPELNRGRAPEDERDADAPRVGRDRGDTRASAPDDPLPRALLDEESPGAHPLLERGHKPRKGDDPRYGTAHDPSGGADADDERRDGEA